MIDREILERLNAATAEERLGELEKVLSEEKERIKPNVYNDTNNHIHTKYSFSPYSPTAAVYAAYASGLCTAGIVDHDSISGAREFIEAGKMIGIATTIGCEVRVNMTGTALEGLRLNNPDEVNSAYIAFHGVPHDSIDELDSILSEIRKNREERDRKQVDILNTLIPGSVALDYDRDVRPISMAADGGSVTERHILMALSDKLTGIYGKGESLISFIENDLGVEVRGGARKALEAADDPFYGYSVLNVLKSEFVPKFFIEGGSDQFPVKYMVDAAKRLGAIPTYCYLGDVGESPTGDKKAQKFEDDILGELFPALREIGFIALAYMPSRNTAEQLDVVMKKADEFGFIQISGEDINQPSQKFVCEKLRDPKFAHLVSSTWALVGHELAATADKGNIIYCDRIKSEYPDIFERIDVFSGIGKEYSPKGGYDGDPV